MKEQEVNPEKNPDSNKPKVEEGSAQYPYFTADDLMPRMREISNHFGVGGQPATRKEICVLLKKAEPTLVYFFSACIQYNFLVPVGKGLVVSDLFEKINNPVFGETSRRAARLEAFNNPSLYKKLIDVFNNKTLPNEEGLINLLKSKEYNVHSGTAARAAKIFYENGRSMTIIDSSNRLTFIMPVINGQDRKQETKSQEEVSTPQPNPPVYEKMFKLPIDLGDKTAFLEYPKDITIDEIETLKIMLDASLKALELRKNKIKKENE